MQRLLSSAFSRQFTLSGIKQSLAQIAGWSMQEGMTSQQMVDALMLAVWRRGKPVAFPPHAAASWGLGCQLVYCSAPCERVDVSAFVNVLVVREELA